MAVEYCLLNSCVRATVRVQELAQSVVGKEKSAQGIIAMQINFTSWRQNNTRV